MRHDDELRRLLRDGPVPAEDERLAHGLRRLRGLLCAPPPDEVAERHLAAITAAAARVTPATRDVPTPVHRLRRFGRRVAALGAFKLATVAAAAAAATGGGLAATGQLPAPVQEEVADVLSHVGIHVPSGTGNGADERAEERGTEPAEPAVVGSAPPTEVAPALPDDAPDRRPGGLPTAVPEDTDDDEPLTDRPTGPPSGVPSDHARERHGGPPEERGAGGAQPDAPAHRIPRAPAASDASEASPFGRGSGRADPPDEHPTEEGSAVGGRATD